MTHSRPSITKLLADSELSPRRDLGQNFVADPNTVRKIAHLAGVGPADHVIEIGAGLGSLTLALAETGASITGIEVDRGVVPILTNTTEHLDNVTIVEADARTLDWDAQLASADEWTLVANLPYNIATPLVCDLLDDVPKINQMLVMVQREVGERFAAAPGSKQYGAVTVKIDYWGNAAVVGMVPASVFVPRPSVESALVRITRDRPPSIDNPVLRPFQATPNELFALVKTAFGQRRKMLRRSLAVDVGADAFELAAIDPTRRPETLDVHEWLTLATAVNATRTQPASRPPAETTDTAHTTSPDGTQAR